MFTYCTSKCTLLLGRTARAFRVARDMGIRRAPYTVRNHLFFSTNHHDNQRFYSLERQITFHSLADQQRFDLCLGDVCVGHIDYEVLPNGDLDLYETVIADEFKGKGMGKLLARLTFEHVIRQNGQMRLTCSFLVHYYQQNEELYKKHVVED